MTTQKILRGRWVIADSQTVIADGAVVVEGDRIAACGPWHDLRARYREAEAFGSERAAVMPGLINAHHHSAGATALQHGLPDLLLEPWILLHARLRAGAPYLDTLLSSARLLRTGVTSVVDLNGGGGTPAAYAERRGRALDAYDRAGIIGKAGELIRERADAIARVLTLEEGKPLPEAKLEVLVAADIFQWYAEEGKRAYGRIIPSRIPGSRQMVVREPVGPVAAFTPWNFPAVTPARKMAGALAGGCSCIIKPSEETPGTTIAMMRALEDLESVHFGICGRGAGRVSIGIRRLFNRTWAPIGNLKCNTRRWTDRATPTAQTCARGRKRRKRARAARAVRRHSSR